ncbi:adrenodoxin, mitochondrial-like [Stylophora pistillata]|uniref:adrenodoxin, mitochondrial-like n=1 Tax=Stylophora pistillata TaxID=50429 RepID=UPI000C04DFFF|nr:adrenodoxin, mitochondrial-like [Stylophora pistillata]
MLSTEQGFIHWIVLSILGTTTGDLIIGACEGTLSCSTCHLIFEPEEMKTLNLDEPSDEELDMLDLAYGLEDTSRLGCQIIVTKNFEGITLRVPKAHRDVRDL